MPHCATEIAVWVWRWPGVSRSNADTWRDVWRDVWRDALRERRQRLTWVGRRETKTGVGMVIAPIRWSGIGRAWPRRCGRRVWRNDAPLRPGAGRSGAVLELTADGGAVRKSGCALAISIVGRRRRVEVCGDRGANLGQTRGDG